MIENLHVKNEMGEKMNSSYGHESFLLKVFCKMPLGHNLVLNVKKYYSHCMSMASFLIMTKHIKVKKQAANAAPG